MNEKVARKLPRNNRERGASLVEYSLLVALIAMVAIVAVRNFGKVVEAQFEDSRKVIAGAGSIVDSSDSSGSGGRR